MISWPKNELQQRWAVEFLLQLAGATVPIDSHFLFWIVEERPVWVVALHGWLGKTVEATFASDRPRMLPRKYARACCHYVFHSLKKEMFFATVNSNNTAALRLDLWLGFKELYRGVGLHSDDGDLVVLGMRKSECRWIQEGKPREELSAATA